MIYTQKSFLFYHGFIALCTIQHFTKAQGNNQSSKNMVTRMEMTMTVDFFDKQIKFGHEIEILLYIQTTVINVP